MTSHTANVLVVSMPFKSVIQSETKLRHGGNVCRSTRNGIIDYINIIWTKLHIIWSSNLKGIFFNLGQSEKKSTIIVMFHTRFRRKKQCLWWTSETLFVPTKQSEIDVFEKARKCITFCISKYDYKI